MILLADAEEGGLLGAEAFLVMAGLCALAAPLALRLRGDFSAPPGAHAQE